MSEEGVDRRLTTILSTDVVGYSRLMGEDEAGTLAALKAHRKELIVPKEAQYHGRTIKLMGDGTLMEFGSVVDAVHFAVEMQIAMQARNAEVPEDRQIIYRIGINIGDIIVEGDDIYGDGVNVASRLEGLAEPGGICASHTVINHVKGKVELDFEDLGDQEVKNIAEPVRVYRVALNDKAAALVTPLVETPVRVGPLRRRHIAAGLVVGLIVIGGLIWWQPWVPSEQPAAVEQAALPLPDKPSIVVLPFVNLYDDAEKDYFADGFTNAITTHLSKFPQLFVISATTAFTYKGSSLRVKDIAHDLGIAYVLEGSVQQGADELNVHVQLIEAETERHIWAEQYDVSPEKLFSVQADLIAQIVGTLRFALEDEAMEARRRRPTDSLQTYDLYLKALAVSKNWDDAFGEAIGLLKQAIGIEEDFLEAHYVISELYLLRWRFGMADDPNEALRLARLHAARAMQIDQKDYRGHFVLGRLYLFADHDHDSALAEFQRALADNPNDAELVYYMGFLRFLMGQAEEAIAWNDKAKRLHPRYPGWYNWNAALAHVWIEDYEKALVMAKTAIAANPTTLAPRRILIVTLVEMGRLDEAKQEVTEFLKIGPDFRLSTFRNTPFKHQIDQDRYYDAMRAAGIPD